MKTKVGSSLAFCLVAAALVACAGSHGTSQPGLGEGKPAPGFTLPSLAGEPVSLASLRGKVVLINLWATWCPACKAEIPILQAAHEAYQGEGLVILGIDVGEPADVVAPFVAREGMTYPVLLDQNASMMSQFRVLGLPMSVLVDRDGIIRVRHQGDVSAAELRSILAGLLP